jgi:hypothetical protein
LYYYDDGIKEGEMDGACSTHGRYAGFLSENLNGTDNLDYLGIDEMIIKKMDLR